MQWWCKGYREPREAGTEVMGSAVRGERFSSAAGEEGAGRDRRGRPLPATLEREGNAYGLDEDQNSLEKFLAGRAWGQLEHAGEVRSKVKNARKSIWCVVVRSYPGQCSWMKVKEQIRAPKE